MICKNKEDKKLVGFLTVVILLIVLVSVVFELGTAMKAILGTIILGLVCMVRAMISAVEVPADVEIDKPVGIQADAPKREKVCATSVEVKQPVRRQKRRRKASFSRVTNTHQ